MVLLPHQEHRLGENEGKALTPGPKKGRPTLHHKPLSPWPRSQSQGREASPGGDRAQGASYYLPTFMAGGEGWGRPSPPGQQPAPSPASRSLLPPRVPPPPLIPHSPSPPNPQP